MLVALSACSSTPDRQASRAPDWEDPQTLQPALNEPGVRAPGAATPLLRTGESTAAGRARLQASALASDSSQSSAKQANGNRESDKRAKPVPAHDNAGHPSGPTLFASFRSHPEQAWIPLQRWSRGTGTVRLNSLGSLPVPAFALHSPNGVMMLSAGSLLARWDGLDVRLGFAPQLIDEQPYAHALDLSKVLEPLLLGSRFCPSACRVIVIDPGHGGENSGTKSSVSPHFEKEFTLDWALRLQRLLCGCGWQAFLTRSNDIDLALSNRVAVAEQHKAGLFLSLHFNSAAPDETEAGLETYCLTPAGMASSLTRGFEDDPAQVYPNNAFDTENLLLAVQVHRALLAVNGHHDRGVRHARFPGVLRNQQRPAILIEAGYLSNRYEARLIADAEYRQKLAEAVAHALQDSRRS